MWGGPGIGANCSICGAPVTSAEIEFEIQFARDGSNPELDKFHVHIRCFAAWEFERGGLVRERSDVGQRPDLIGHLGFLAGVTRSVPCW